jgi:hypothetical protein
MLNRFRNRVGSNRTGSAKKNTRIPLLSTIFSTQFSSIVTKASSSYLLLRSRQSNTQPTPYFILLIILFKIKAPNSKGSNKLIIKKRKKERCFSVLPQSFPIQIFSTKSFNSRIQWKKRETKLPQTLLHFGFADCSFRFQLRYRLRSLNSEFSDSVLVLRILN